LSHSGKSRAQAFRLLNNDEGSTQKPREMPVGKLRLALCGDLCCLYRFSLGVADMPGVSIMTAKLSPPQVVGHWEHRQQE
jgi:hypothetical protein